MQTADLDTAKIHWNSVVSTPLARYMCLDIKNFYLTAALEYFECSRMPLSLFPAWIRKQQYEMEKHSLNGYIHLEMWQAVWGLPQAGILANKRLRRKLAPFDILKVQILRDCGTTNHAPSRSHWWWRILALNMRIKTMWIT